MSIVTISSCYYDKKNELYYSEEETDIVLWTKDVPYFITNEKKDRVITRINGINDERVDYFSELGNNDMLDYKYCLIVFSTKSNLSILFFCQVSYAKTNFCFDDCQ